MKLCHLMKLNPLNQICILFTYFIISDNSTQEAQATIMKKSKWNLITYHPQMNLITYHPQIGQQALMELSSVHVLGRVGKVERVEFLLYTYIETID